MTCHVFIWMWQWREKDGPHAAQGRGGSPTRDGSAGLLWSVIKSVSDMLSALCRTDSRNKNSVESWQKVWAAAAVLDRRPSPVRTSITSMCRTCGSVYSRRCNIVMCWLWSDPDLFWWLCSDLADHVTAGDDGHVIQSLTASVVCVVIFCTVSTQRDTWSFKSNIWW